MMEGGGGQALTLFDWEFSHWGADSVRDTDALAGVVSDALHPHLPG